MLVNPIHCGYRPENVITLLDNNATQAAIRHGLTALADRTNKDSTALIYFSGHGGRIDSGSHTGEYLLPVDTIYPTDEDLARTAISGDEFTAALKNDRGAEGLGHLRLLPCGRNRSTARPRRPNREARLVGGLLRAAQIGQGPGHPCLIADGRVLLRAARRRVWFVHRALARRSVRGCGERRWPGADFRPLRVPPAAGHQGSAQPAPIVQGRAGGELSSGPLSRRGQGSCAEGGGRIPLRRLYQLCGQRD